MTAKVRQMEQIHSISTKVQLSEFEPKSHYYHISRSSVVRPQFFIFIFQTYPIVGTWFRLARFTWILSDKLLNCLGKISALFMKRKRERHTKKGIIDISSSEYDVEKCCSRTIVIYDVHFAVMQIFSKWTSGQCTTAHNNNNALRMAIFSVLFVRFRVFFTIFLFPEFIILPRIRVPFSFKHIYNTYCFYCAAIRIVDDPFYTFMCAPSVSIVLRFELKTFFIPKKKRSSQRNEMRSTNSILPLVPFDSIARPIAHIHTK